MKATTVRYHPRLVSSGASRLQDILTLTDSWEAFLVRKPQVYFLEMACRFLDGGAMTNLLRTIHDFGLGGTKYKTDDLLKSWKETIDHRY